MHALPHTAEDACAVRRRAPCLRPNLMKPDLAAYPARRAVLSDLERRPSAQRAAEAEGPGRMPFTAATYPAPPEGSAT